MTVYGRITANLEYDSRLREDVDISDILLQILHDDDDVEEFASNPREFDRFGDEYQWQMSLEDASDGHNDPFTPEDTFSFEKALTKATGGTIKGLLPMWHAWKAFMTSPDEVARQNKAHADEYAEKVADHIRMHTESHQRAFVLALLSRLLAHPGAIEMIPDAITESGMPAIDAMKSLRDLAQ